MGRHVMTLFPRDRGARPVELEFDCQEGLDECSDLLRQPRIAAAFRPPVAMVGRCEWRLIGRKWRPRAAVEAT